MTSRATQEYFSFTVKRAVHYFFSKISSLTLVLSIRTVLDSFYLFIFCSFAVNLTLKMSFYSKSVICSEHTFDWSLKLLERVGAGRDGEVRPVSIVFNTLVWYTARLVKFDSLRQHLRKSFFLWLHGQTSHKHGKRLKTLLHRTFWHFWKSAGSGRTEVSLKRCHISSLFFFSRRLSLALFSLLFCLFWLVCTDRPYTLYIQSYQTYCWWLNSELIKLDYLSV